MEPITQRDVHIAVEMADGTTFLARRRNPDTTAWELWAAAHNLDAGKAPTLSLTYQAWHALRRTGTRVGKFDDWAADVDEVYPAAPDGRRLAVKDGQLCIDDEPVEESDLDPTPPAVGSGKS